MKKTFILAISGGVDSVVLFHKLSSVQPPNVSYIVAHVNHGIRPQAARDALFVRSLAKKAGYTYECIELNLGPRASEDRARTQRYAFLFEMMRKYKAEAVITAHHQDDVLETAIINILRGTTARGLIGYTHQGVLRPFIHKKKSELLAYAKEHGLLWQEDETNQDTRYLRNYVRLEVLPLLTDVQKTQLLKLRERLIGTYTELDDQIKKLLVQSLHKGKLVRVRFVVLPYKVQLELMAMWLRLHSVPYDRQMIERAVTAAKVLLPGKHIELAKNCTLFSEKHMIILHVDSQDV